jgi:hypothetical protein
VKQLANYHETWPPKLENGHVPWNLTAGPLAAAFGDDERRT